MLNELFWIIFGGLVGWVAAILQQEYSPKRITVFIMAGMIGGVLGGALGGWLGAEALEYNAGTTGMMFAVFGAIVFVAAATLVHNRDSE
jgi:uncharacterized membrane protein YeaQ/YmgE (transglycosylase-associated protein family)